MPLSLSLCVCGAFLLLHPSRGRERESVCVGREGGGERKMMMMMMMMIGVYSSIGIS